MPGILADANIEGHVAVLVRALQRQPLRELWESADVPVFTFEMLEWPRNLDDLSLWLQCQERDIVLLTGNRNLESPLSLEAAIRQRGNEQSLPVLTLANPDRVLKSGDYAERTAIRMLECLLEIDALRGCGRIFIP